MTAIIDHEARRKSIGSSDAPTLCGVNPFASPYDVWALKTGRVEPFAGNVATDAGNRLQDTVIAWACERLGVIHANTDVFIEHRDNAWMTANLDARAVLPDRRSVIIEAKTGGITSPLRGENWTEYEFPEAYMVQVQHQLEVAGPEIDHAYLAALIPPIGFRLYRVERNPDLIAAIMGREASFWFDHILADVPPDDTPSMDVMQRLRRVPKKSVVIAESLVAKLQEAKDMAKKAKDLEEAAKAELLAALGDAEQGTHPGGSVTYFETKRAGYTVEPTSYRQLRFVKGK